MEKSLGLVELKSIPVGVQTADEMLKAANVELLVATAICPGKYIIIVNGQVGAVRSSMAAGRQTAGSFLIGEHTITDVHPSVAPALVGTNEVEKIRALGIVETISALTIVDAANIAAKASNVTLMEVRVARGLGGKGYMMLTGEISAVKAAMNSCQTRLADTGEITSTCVIASPHKGLLEKLL